MVTDAFVANSVRFDPSQLTDIQSLLHKISNDEVNFWNPNLQGQITREEADFLRLPIDDGVYLYLVLHDTQVHHKILRRSARLAVYDLTVRGCSAETLAQAFQGTTLLKKKGTGLQKQIEGYIQAGVS